MTRHPDRSSAPILLALHGLGADHRQPLSYLSEAVRTRYDVLAPDLPAHGDHPLPQPAGHLDLGTLTRDVVELVEERLATGRQVVVLGISMGAAIATGLMGAIPERVSHAVLIRPAWRWTYSPPNLQPLVEIGELLLRLGPEHAEDAFQISATFARVSAVSAAAAAALLDQCKAPLAQQRARRLIDIPASSVPMPLRYRGRVTVVGNERDPLHPLQLARQVAGDLNARLVTVAPRYDDPGAHMRELTDFLDQTLG